MNNLIVFHEKYCNRHFSYSNEEELNKIFLKIFKERVKESGWYLSSLIDYYKELIKNKDYHKIRMIMSERKDYEYESFYLTELEELKK